MFLKISAVLVLAALLLECDARRCCGRNRNRDPNSVTRLSRKERRFAHAVNDFGVHLYNELAPDNENLVLAPVSALTAMSMVMLGAEGETQQNLFDSLRLQPFRRARKVHRAFRSYRRSVARLQGNVAFDTGNAMYISPTIPVERRFKRNIRKYYGGEAKTFDFSHSDGPEAPINEWIEMKTRGKIRDFLGDGSIDFDTVMWLINAVYFQGTWDSIFEEEATRNRRFRLNSNEDVQVPMMSQDYFYASKVNSALGVKVLEIPYEGNRFSFFIILPDGIGLSDLEARLDYETLEGLLTNLTSPSRFQISIPKFSITSSMNLVDYLQDLGVRHVFDRNLADLSGINPREDMFVDVVKQKAVLEVNEKGTVAAAVTAVRVVVESLPPQFIVDRPFMYVLRDKTTATNVFIGRVTNPTRDN